jgi:hypothetical protein
MKTSDIELLTVPQMWILGSQKCIILNSIAFHLLIALSFVSFMALFFPGVIISEDSDNILHKNSLILQNKNKILFPI